MAKPLSLALALLFHPAPVTSVTVAVNPDDSVTLGWSLPADPSVVGVTIFRDHLGSSATVIFELWGSPTSFTDFSPDPHESYRYWIHTRDAQGDLSDGVWVEVFGDHHPHGHSEWWCYATGAAGARPPWAALTLAGLLGLGVLLRPRRVTTGR